MEKRSEIKKVKGQPLKERLQHFLMVLFCILLLFFLIGVTDMSTRRMMMSNDDKYALGLRLTEGNILRIDIAGEKLLVDMEPALNIKNSIMVGTKRYFTEFKGFIESKFGK